MERFAIRSIPLNQLTEHLPILRAHEATVAFRRTNHQNYMLATALVNIDELMQKLFPKQSAKTIHAVVESPAEPGVILIPRPNRQWTASINQR